MANDPVHTDIPTIPPEQNAGSRKSPGNTPSAWLSEGEVVYLESKIGSKTGQYFDGRIEDIKPMIATLQRALAGDEAAWQTIQDRALSAGRETLNSFSTTLENVDEKLKGFSMEQAGKKLQASMTEMKDAYLHRDLDRLAEAGSTVVILMAEPNPGKKLDLLQDLEKLGKVANNAEEGFDHLRDAGSAARHVRTQPEPWAGNTNTSRPHDPAQMHGHRNGPVEIDGVRYEDGKAPVKVTRGPLELEPRVDHEPVIPQASRRTTAKESAPENDHTVRNAAIVGTAVLGGTAAIIAGNHYLEDAERKGRATLSDAYKAGIQDALTLSDADRNARYEATIKQHPELREAIAGYEMVRQHTAKDGKITDNDKAILDLVASNTSIQILNGKVADIKIISEPFQQASRDADHQTGPSYGY